MATGRPETKPRHINTQGVILGAPPMTRSERVEAADRRLMDFHRQNLPEELDPDGPLTRLDDRSRLRGTAAG